MGMNLETFEHLYDFQYPRVYRYLLGRLRDHHAAEAVAAQVFATALAAFQKGTVPRRQAGTWLVGIADHMASRRRRQMSEAPGGETPGIAGDPEEIALSRLVRRMRSGTVDMESPEYQKLLLLRLAGRSAHDVGEVIDEVEGTVRSLQLRVMAALRDFWKRDDR